LGELEKAVETFTCRFVFPQHFLVSQTSTRVSMTRWKHNTYFLFLKCLIYLFKFFYIFVFVAVKGALYVTE